MHMVCIHMHMHDSHRYVNTVACKSAISYIDGNKGILRYRGFPIEELAERASFLEVWCVVCMYGRWHDQVACVMSVHISCLDTSPHHTSPHHRLHICLSLATSPLQHSSVNGKTPSCATLPFLSM